MSVLKVPADFFVFAKKYNGTELGNVALDLLAGIEEGKTTAKSCCQLRTCRRGKPMWNTSDVKVGDRVKVNPESNHPIINVTYLQERGLSDEGTVRSVGHHNNTIGVNEWLGANKFNIVMDNVAATLLFCKC